MCNSRELSRNYFMLFNSMVFKDYGVFVGDKTN